jgi:hypothetical protein
MHERYSCLQTSILEVTITNIYFRSNNYSLIPILLENHSSFKTFVQYIGFVNECCKISIYVIIDELALAIRYFRAMVLII